VTAYTDRHRTDDPVQTCVVCNEPKYQKHAERCAGRPPYAIARDIVDGGDYERVEVLRLARAFIEVDRLRRAAQGEA
jgi:hypothetical protein